MTCLKNEIIGSRVVRTQLDPEKYLAEVAQRAGDIDNDTTNPWKAPDYFPARRSTWTPARNGLALKIVAQCPDGKIERYDSCRQAADAMRTYASEISRALDQPVHCRDRKWYRLTTWEEQHKSTGIQPVSLGVALPTGKGEKECSMWNLNWEAKSDAEAACKITASIALALMAYVYHLAGWTVTVHYAGRVLFKIPELW